jgi:repressor LexA
VTEVTEATNAVPEDLTERQTQILDFIRDVTRQRNYPPSVREIGLAVGLSSSSTVHNHLNHLERRGLIRRDPTKSRTVQLVEAAGPRDAEGAGVSLPIVGNVAAGQPILAEQNIEDRLLMSPELAQDGWFALRVRGDSMINAGILDGDLVIVKPGQDAPDGTIIVALIGDEATVKRLQRRGGRVQLIAENPDYPPIEPEEASMVGTVRGVVRTY